jgi:glycosyltransferase involved in cell wall biosynthesis
VAERDRLDVPLARAPIVSVIIPTYNTARYIAETLGSVFEQTYRDFEVIVINDGSPDTDVLEVVLQPFLDRIVYLKQENQGPAAARNLGIRRARGQYVAFLDSDDYWLPEYLASQMSVFDAVPSPDMVSVDTVLFGASPYAGKTFWELFPPRGPATLKSLVTRDCAIVTSCTVARRSVVLGVGLFDESFRVAEDLDLWLRMTYSGARLVLQRKALGRRRVRDDALTAAGLRMQVEEVRVLKKLEQTLRLPSDILLAFQQRRAQSQASVDLEQGKRYLEAGEIDRARDSLQGALAFFQTRKLRLVVLALRVAPRLASAGASIWRRWVIRASDHG